MAGVLIFGLAFFREIEVEGHSTGTAIAVGLAVGGGMAVTLGVGVAIYWARKRRAEPVHSDE